ncbi:MAG: methyltransferase [Myxococcota bacterium]
MVSCIDVPSAARHESPRARRLHITDSARKNPPRRPPGWRAPGPPAPPGEPELGPDEIASWLLGDWRIIQRTDGHRWSLDDFLTAWLARDVLLAAGTPPRTILDLGTGIGSVALMHAWCWPAASVTGVEAQDVSFGLARRSVALNGVAERMTLVHGDLRDYAGGPFDLVTGTPPYFDDPLQTRSDAVQKGPCRFEDRGGIADYLATARRTVAPTGLVVVCHASRQRDRVMAAVAATDFRVVRVLEAIPKAGKAALVDVIALALDRGAAAMEAAFEPLVVRDAQDQWTDAFLAVRLSMGMPPRPTRPS